MRKKEKETYIKLAAAALSCLCHTWHCRYHCFEPEEKERNKILKSIKKPMHGKEPDAWAFLYRYLSCFFITTI